jgi:hypothetical protein
LFTTFRCMFVAMPSEDLPGGPTDPENVLNAIRNGATWRESLIYLAGAPFSLHAEGGKWELSPRLGVRMNEDTFARLHKVTTNPREPGYLRLDGLRYRLDAIDGWAELVPA